MAEPELPHVDSLVHEPARLRVLAFLALVERADFMYLLRQTALSRGNLSVQTSKLEAAGLVDATKELVDGRPRTTFALTADGREALKRYRETMLQIMAGFPE
jgi:DNA-binding MarR family transcriptional regulator